MGQVESKGRRIDDKTPVDIESWLESITKGRPASEAELIRQACKLAQTAHTGQTRASGEPYVRHSIAVAQILADLRLDHEA
ncbi:MAG: HD domain-containing protein, partial [Acidiferrobacterales bacterium]